MRLFLLPALFLLFIQGVSAQDPVFQRLFFPVQQSGETLEFALAGGLNTPQFNAADLNNDGLQDLVIFDRAGDKVLPFLNNGTTGETDYTFAPEYAANFPKLLEYMLLRDYNQDGAADIFCSSLQPSSQEIQVFRGYYDGNILKFQPFTFYYANCPTCDDSYIYYPDEIPGNWNNLPISKSDYPAVDDIDGDGDLDIVCFEASLTTSMYYLRNMSMEMGFGLDSLKFELVDKCYGKFTETGLEACHACLSPNGVICCQGFAAPAPELDERSDNRHPGSTALTFDQDGDGDKDLVLGNISFNCILGFTNGGTPNQAWMTAQDTAFPHYNTPVDLAVFPASFFLDLDNDGKKDFVAAPNNKTIGEDRKNVWFYKNIASGPGTEFELESKSLIVGEMVDVGSVSHPTFADVNADGLLDLVVGNYGYYTPGTATNASLALYLNTGTSTQPAFTLSDPDWQGLSEFSPNDFDFAPAFGDLDADGDLDMLVGTNVGGLFCYFNQAGPGNPMQLVRDLDPMWVTMDVGISTVPAIYDLDGDNRPDVIVGERNGNVNFFKNNGSPTEPIYDAAPNLSNLGALDARLPNELIGHSTPVLVETSDGLRLVMGAQSGQLEAYSGITVSSSAFTSVSANWGGIDEGTRSYPAIADLDNDGLLDLVTGNQRGGLSAYRTDWHSTSSATHTPPHPIVSIQLSPNPARDRVYASIPSGKALQWQVFNSLGQKMAYGSAPSGAFDFPVNIWPSGIYFVEISTGTQQAAARLRVQH